MNIETKNYILARISQILDELPDDEPKKDILPKPREMLTITECTRMVKGLSAHTLRLLVKRGEIPSFRTGEGKAGKLLIPKDALLEYFEAL